jgi:hypothetical protein
MMFRSGRGGSQIIIPFPHPDIIILILIHISVVCRIPVEDTVIRKLQYQYRTGTYYVDTHDAADR